MVKLSRFEVKPSKKIFFKKKFFTQFYHGPLGACYEGQRIPNPSTTTCTISAQLVKTAMKRDETLVKRYETPWKRDETPMTRYEMPIIRRFDRFASLGFCLCGGSFLPRHKVQAALPCPACIITGGGHPRAHTGLEWNEKRGLLAPAMWWTPGGQNAAQRERCDSTFPEREDNAVADGGWRVTEGGWTVAEGGWRATDSG